MTSDLEEDRKTLRKEKVTRECEWLFWEQEGRRSSDVLRRGDRSLEEVTWRQQGEREGERRETRRPHR